MNEPSNTAYIAPTSDFREVGAGKSVIAFFLGMAIIAAFIVIGHHYVAVPFLALSLFITLVWNKAPRPWIFLVSILAASPVALSKQAQVEPNLIFAFWFVVFNMQYLSKLPKWIYVAAVLVVFGFLTSSINWISGDFIRSLAGQTAQAYTYILGTFILLPIVYSRIGESRDHAANLRGLLFFLIVPSTLMLFLAHELGTPFVYHGIDAEGAFSYRLGTASVNFSRTEVGFIFAALICASTAILVSRVRGPHRLFAGVCLASNVFLLLATGSFGSILACLFGLAAIFYALFRTANIARVLAWVIVMACMLLLIWSLSPGSMKEYLGKHYQERAIQGTDQDRFVLWGLAINHLLQHPEGVGLTFTVGDTVKSNPHNDYLMYAVSYGVTGGLAYAYLIAGLMISFLRRLKNAINDPSTLAIHLAGLGVVVAFAVNSMADHAAANRWYFNAIWSIIWYSYFCSRAPQKEGVSRRRDL